MSCVAKRAAVAARVGIVGMLAGAVVLAANDPAEAARKRRPAAKRAPVEAYSPPYAAIVVDAKTGRVLYEADADGLRYPASITKVMTLYLLFEELEAGRLTVDSRLSVSSYAALQAPTKLGLKPGSTIRVEDAIKALVTKSANDAAVVIAENIAGTEEDFADRMTRKARALGMSRTVFRNANGLPNNAQVTTARDLATLSRAIQERFPRYYGYFSTRAFSFAGRTHANHNKLLGRVEGVDGIKTGYTRASGFNLATSVKANGRHIVGVVLGGRSGASRDAKMRELIALNLPKASPGGRTAPLIAERAPEPAPKARPAVVAEATGAGAGRTSTRPIEVTGTATPSAVVSRPLPPTTTAQLRPAPPVPRPAMEIAEQPSAEKLRTAPQQVAEVPLPLPPPAQPVAAKPSLPMPTKTAGQLASLSIAPSLRWVVGASPATQQAGIGELARSYAAETSPNPIAMQIATASRSAKVVAAPAPAAAIQVASAGPVDLPPSPVAAPPVAAKRAAEPPAAARAGWLIQIAATPDENKALELLSRAKEATNVLRSAEPFTEPVAKDDVTLYRARFAGLDKRTAQLACDALKRADMSCFAIKN